MARKPIEGAREEVVRKLLEGMSRLDKSSSPSSVSGDRTKSDAGESPSRGPTITAEDLAGFQINEGHSSLSALLQRCMRRFRLASSLVSVDGPVFRKIRDAEHVGNVDLTALFPAWQVICERYREERFDPQPSLIKRHDVEVMERWAQFLHWELFPRLLREDEFVRNILRATDLLPCQSKQHAAAALSQYLEEMDLPFGPPPWDDADIEGRYN